MAASNATVSFFRESCKDVSALLSAYAKMRRCCFRRCADALRMHGKTTDEAGEFQVSEVVLPHKKWCRKQAPSPNERDTVDIRKAREGDLDRIMEIIADGRVALANLGVDQWQGEYPYRSVIEEDIAHDNSYVVEEGDTVMATFMLGFEGDSIYDAIEHGSWLTDSSSDEPCYGVIHRVAVAREHRGKGAASMIMHKAEDLVRQAGKKSIRIDTHPGNVPMRRLFEKAGYKECGIVYVSYADAVAPERVAYEKVLA